MNGLQISNAFSLNPDCSPGCPTASFNPGRGSGPVGQLAQNGDMGSHNRAGEELCCKKIDWFARNLSRTDARIMCMNNILTVGCFFFFFFHVIRVDYLEDLHDVSENHNHSGNEPGLGLSSRMLQQASVCLAARQGKLLAFNKLDPSSNI